MNGLREMLQSLSVNMTRGVPAVFMEGVPRRSGSKKVRQSGSYQEIMPGSLKYNINLPLLFKFMSWSHSLLLFISEWEEDMRCLHRTNQRTLEGYLVLKEMFGYPSCNRMKHFP